MIVFDNDASTESLVETITQGGNVLKAGDTGIAYQQYKAGTALANSTTETSLFTLTSIAPQLVGNMAQAAVASSIAIPSIPSGFLALGTGFSGNLYGTIATTGTPTLRVRVVLKNSAGTVVYTLADSTATSLSAITGTTELVVNFDAVCSATGTSGAMIGRIAVTYGTSATANTVIKAVATSVTVDTTQAYSLDVLATWGTASASNTLNTLIGTIGVY